MPSNVGNPPHRRLAALATAFLLVMRLIAFGLGAAIVAQADPGYGLSLQVHLFHIRNEFIPMVWQFPTWRDTTESLFQR